MNKTVKSVAEDMEAFTSQVYDASIEQAFGGTTDCKHFEITSYPAKYRKHILMYLETEKGVCECFAEYLDDNGYLKTS